MAAICHTIVHELVEDHIPGCPASVTDVLGDRSDVWEIDPNSVQRLPAGIRVAFCSC